MASGKATALFAVQFRTRKFQSLFDALNFRRARALIGYNAPFFNDARYTLERNTKIALNYVACHHA